MLAPVNLRGCNINTHTREKKPYHFGNLEETLIEQEIELIHKRGIEKLSLRKVAEQVGVSAITCYNHSGNIDELLRGMYSYVIDRLAAALKQTIEDNPCHNAIISVGVAYMELFTKYPHYFSFLFDSEYLGIQIKETEIAWDSSFTPFEVFVNSAKKGMRELNIGERELRDNLLAVWTAVHGLVAMTNMKGVQYDSGDQGALTEKILFNKVIL